MFVRYKKNLKSAEEFGVKKGFTNGAAMGFIWLTIFGAYGLGFWYGGKLFREDDDYGVATVIIVSSTNSQSNFYYMSYRQCERGRGNKN